MSSSVVPGRKATGQCMRYRSSCSRPRRCSVSWMTALASLARWWVFQSLEVTQMSSRGMSAAAMPFPVWSSLPFWRSRVRQLAAEFVLPAGGGGVRARSGVDDSRYIQAASMCSYPFLRPNSTAWGTFSGSDSHVPRPSGGISCNAVVVAVVRSVATRYVLRAMLWAHPDQSRDLKVSDVVLCIR